MSTCIDCGKEISNRAKRCRKHHIEHQRKKAGLHNKVKRAIMDMEEGKIFHPEDIIKQFGKPSWYTPYVKDALEKYGRFWGAKAIGNNSYQRMSEEEIKKAKIEAALRTMGGPK